MALSNDLISQFVKVTRDDTTKKQETTVYGTVKKYDGALYVQIDGSELYTPFSTTTEYQEDERVTIRIKDHTAMVTGNMSSRAARIDTVNAVSDRVGAIEADYVKTKVLEADYAKIETLEADYAKIATLEADYVKTEKLEADYVKTEKLEADYVKTEKLEADYAKIETLEADYVKTTALDAAVGRVGVLESDVADINTLMFGSATGDTIQTNFANSVVSLVGTGVIKDAMIESVSAGKIAAGSIDTGKVTISGDDSRMWIQNGTIQIKDENNTVRVQIGRDAENDYSLSVWDADGMLMFSEGGLTKDAIKKDIIINEMISNETSISSEKLDIGHLFYKEDGDTKQLNASAVKFDGKTLEAYFNELTSTSDTVKDQGTQLTAIQGQISSKIWLQEINGRNLLLDSAVEHTNKNYKVAEYVPAIPLTAGEQYAISVCVTPATDVTRFAIFTSNGNQSLAYLPVSGTDQQILTGTFTMEYKPNITPDNNIENANIQVYRYPKVGTAAGSSTVHWIKIEAGETATDWTPGPGETVGLTTKYSTLEQDLNKFKTTVSETYATDGELTAAKESIIEQTSGSINLAVSSVTVGGRNLLMNSSFATDSESWQLSADASSSISFEEKNGFNCAHLTHSELGHTKYIRQNIQTALLPDTTYVLSGWMLAENASMGTSDAALTLQCSGYYDNNGADTWFGYGSQTPTINSGSGKWEYLSFSFITDSKLNTATRVYAYIYSKNMVGDIYFRNLKLEKGNKATDWTPAPEDVDSDIANLDETVSTHESRIQVLSDSISTLVVGPDGETRMTQTDTGWSFNFDDAALAIAEAAVENGTADLKDKVSDLGDGVNNAQESIDSLKNYIDITEAADGSSAVINIGGKNGYNLRLKSDKLEFAPVDNTNNPVAYIAVDTNSGDSKLFIGDAELMGELYVKGNTDVQSGGIVITQRANGNVGFIWKELGK